MSDLLELTVTDAVAAIAAGELDRSEYASAWAAAAAGDEVNAYLWRPDDAGDAPADTAPGGKAPAEAGAPAGALAGAPIAVKDLFCTEGVPTTAGSRILDGYRPPYTATAVAKLWSAGASLLGKTNMDEFAMGSSNETSAFGPVLNPWDRTRAPGGSSGGSAAAVAAGLAPAAIGTDTGGSIRQPAALCGVVGLKPTYGAISRYGMVAFASSLDQCGPLTRTVADAALLLGVMQGRDPADSTSVGLPEGCAPEPREDLRGLRFGIPAGMLGDGVEAGVRAGFEEAIAAVEELGGEAVELELAHTDYGISAYYVIAPAEASANLSRYDGVRFGFRGPGEDLGSMYEATRDQGFGAEVKRRIMLGTYALSAGYYDAYYGRAQRVRTKIVEDYRGAFERCDLLLTPTSPSVAFELGAKLDDPLSMYLNDLFTAPVSLAGLPAISIPSGLATPDGGGPQLPVGLQVIGPAFGESRLLGAAGVLEQRFAFDALPAPQGGVVPGGAIDE